MEHETYKLDPSSLGIRRTSKVYTSLALCVTPIPLSSSSSSSSSSYLVSSNQLSTVVTIFIITACIILPLANAFYCKFPNEGCDVNKAEECCSGKCVDLHPGTNARCTRLSLHKPCLYTYQCADRLRCGPNNTCCAKYWDNCMKADDCCDPQHGCYQVEGFYYKRCLYPTDNVAGAATISVPSSKMTLTSSVVVSLVMNCVLNQQTESPWRTLVFL